MHSIDDGWESYREQEEKLEHRETQLWWLAIIVIACLAAAIGAIDVFGTGGLWWSSPLSFFDSWITRVALVLSVFLICAYFRDSVRRLRKSHTKLIADLRMQTTLLQHRNDEISRLKDVSGCLVGSIDMQDSLDLVLGTALDAANAQSATIMLTGDDGHHLDRLSAKTLNALGSKTEPCVKQRLARWVIEHDQSLLMNSGIVTPEMEEMEADNIDVSTFITPISDGGKVLGVIAVAGKESGGQFTQPDLDAICTLAGQAGLALGRMHLYRRLQEQVVSLRSAVHELKETQAGLIQSEKLATIGQLAGGLAHEINNPLHIILGRAEMILMDMDPRSSHAKDAEIIKSETQRIAGLVRNLLSFSRSSTMGFMGMVDVNETIEHTIELAQVQEQSENVDIIRRLSSSLPPVFVEKGELQQVFMNIVINAYQAMKKTGGKLIVETSLDDSGHVVTKIIDTGPGIPPEHMDSIFEPFFTTKSEAEGTGLGLSVCKGIVEKYGGEVEVQTRVGEGATFIVKIPSADEEMKEEPQEKTEAA